MEVGSQLKIVYALPKNLGFMISFNPEAQSRMQATETLLQTLTNFLVHLPIQAEPILLATRVPREPSLGTSGATTCDAAATSRHVRGSECVAKRNCLWLKLLMHGQLRAPENDEVPKSPNITLPVTLSPSIVPVNSSVIGIGSVMETFQEIASPVTEPSKDFGRISIG